MSRVVMVQQQQSQPLVASTSAVRRAWSPSSDATRIRPYKPADQPAIVNMCKHVYGGRDYMPHQVDRYHARGCTLLVAEPPGDAPARAGPACGLICAERRGHGSSFLFGLRVADHARGAGVAHALMRAVVLSAAHGSTTRGDDNDGQQQQQQQQLPPPWLWSATIPQNAAARRVFQRAGFRHVRTLDMWPPYDDLHRHEAAVAAAAEGAGAAARAGAEGGEQGGAAGAGAGAGADNRLPPPPPGLLDHMPGARQAAARGAAAAGYAPAQWLRCADERQLRAGLASVRRAQRAAAAAAGRPAPPPLPAALEDDWLPFVYEVHAVRGSAWTAERLRRGEVWLLPQQEQQQQQQQRDGAPSGAGGGGGADSGRAWAAVAVVARSDEFAMPAAGVVAADDAAACAGVEFVAARCGAATFVSFFDRGTASHSLEDGTQQAASSRLLPAFFTSSGARDVRAVLVVGRQAGVAAGENVN